MHNLQFPAQSCTNRFLQFYQPFLMIQYHLGDPVDLVVLADLALLADLMIQCRLEILSVLAHLAVQDFQTLQESQAHQTVLLLQFRL